MKLRALLIFFLIFCWVGCAQKRIQPRGGAGVDYKPSLESPSAVDRSPWELWNFGQDLQGVSIKAPEIREGDAAIKAGDYAKGVRTYRAIDPRSLSTDDREALIVRMASAELTLGQYQRSLDLVSDHFKSQGKGADQVSGHFALLLAYGYGATFDYDQSLAWFTRADSAQSISQTFSNVAASGARLLIASMPQDVFESSIPKWNQDIFIGPFIQQEIVLRQRPEYQAPLRSSSFWRRNMPETIDVPGVDAQPIGQRVEALTVAVLLPTSGPFATLGVNTQNGIELATTVENEPRVTFIYKDSMGDAGIAQTAAQEAVQKEGASVLLGPLLSEPANAVRQTARDLKVSQIALSKSNTFQTGDSIFRFGATTDGQVDALLEQCMTILSMNRFALIYPQTPVGLEFANTFKKYVSAKGGQLLYEATYLPEDTTLFQSIVGEVERADVQGIFMPDSLQKAQEFFSMLSPDFRKIVRPMGPALWDDATQLANSQLIFDRAVFVSPFFQSAEHQVVNRFVDLYFKKFGKKPDFLAAQGFDAATMIIGAARKVLQEGTPFELAFKDIEAYDGVTGTMRVDVSGEVHRAYRIVESRDGELREVKADKIISLDSRDSLQ